ncbi:FtsB/FtsL family cell division protein [Helicobacter macacae]|uniref:Uncharacterized protein n=1 Tax=Helicobacter macacae MIT 99-5501 TaxID=1357400 RepID=V8C5W7_9HELI|nr:hypothetical protein [Helicobacter macacae]ETD22808.1 hypothetical protein HMPREF2086_01607 [Helicobacter macacae MIT 99-5501]
MQYSQDNQSTPKTTASTSTNTQSPHALESQKKEHIQPHIEPMDFPKSSAKSSEKSSVDLSLSALDSALAPRSISTTMNAPHRIKPNQPSKISVREIATSEQSIQMRIDPHERDEIFALELEQKDEGLNVRYLIYAYIGLSLFLLVCMPKVWLSSTIYYTSRDINKLQTQRDLLQEENKRLQNEREKLRYQYLKLNSQPQ